MASNTFDSLLFLGARYANFFIFIFTCSQLAGKVKYNFPGKIFHCSGDINSNVKFQEVLGLSLLQMGVQICKLHHL